ncbi:copper chaperone PCu(A)C [Simiduia aestuariiviva]|uniref:Copper chaperone PCu(A)C n=1 Tax=Simiduia aestuariiviva TaxID=1510459 RepID=A0A839US26_9GAMM|nr:copper chaperone PCu(A)C [Simiduia aestuariiviva]MBB3169511.1 hypothetical protein [Simiduia aestuariiviva]
MILRSGLLLGLLWSSWLSAEMLVSDAWARESVPGTNTSALFATIENTERKATQLVAVVVDGVDKAELHAHNEEGGMMRMRRVTGVSVAGRSSVTLAPGGYHVMLFQLRQPLKAGTELPVEFKFSNGEKVKAVARVLSPADAMPHHNH